jgi:hypothetical protein
MVPDTDLVHLAAILDLLKAKGVKHYKAGGVDVSGNEFVRMEVEFEPTIDVSTGRAEKQEPDPDMCPCGHWLHEHQDGLCLHGCEPEACLPKESK